MGKRFAQIIKDNKSVDGIVKDLKERKLHFFCYVSAEEYRYVVESPLDVSYFEHIEIIKCGKSGRLTFSLRDSIRIGSDPWCEESNFADYERKETIEKDSRVYEDLLSLIRYAPHISGS